MKKTRICTKLVPKFAMNVRFISSSQLYLVNISIKIISSTTHFLGLISCLKILSIFCLRVGVPPPHRHGRSNKCPLHPHQRHSHRLSLHGCLPPPLFKSLSIFRPITTATIYKSRKHEICRWLIALYDVLRSGFFGNETPTVTESWCLLSKPSTCACEFAPTGLLILVQYSHFVSQCSYTVILMLSSKVTLSELWQARRNIR